MRIVCIGGGPAGLYFGLLMKKLNPAHHDLRWSSATAVRHLRLGRRVLRCDHGEHARLGSCRPPMRSSSAFNHWDDIEVLIKGRRMRTPGHGFVGIGRKKLLNILQARCEELGVELVFEREVDSDLDFPDADLIVAADGVNSKIRNRIRRCLQARHAAAAEPLHLARHQQARSTPSPSISARPSTAGSRRISTSSTRAPRPSSSRRPKSVSAPTASTRLDQDAFDRLLRRTSSPKSSRARALMTNARHLRGSAWLNFSRADLRQMEPRSTATATSC